MEDFKASLLKFDGASEPDMTEEEYQKEIAAPVGIEPYKRQQLSILAVDYKGVSASDQRWLKFSFVLGNPEWKQGTETKDGVEKRVFLNKKDKKQRPLYHFLFVPRSKAVSYNGSNGPTPLMFRKLQEFVTALGHDIHISNSAEVVERLFSEPQKLIGAVLDLQPGYERDNVGRNEEGGFSVYNRYGQKRTLLLNGEEVVNNYESRETAEGEAIACGVDVDMKETMLRVLKFFPAKDPFVVKKKVSFDD